MDIPKIFERKIVEMRKPDGSSQFLMTLPKEYGENLKSKGITRLLVIFNYGLGAFPKQAKLTEKALLIFMQEHPELSKLFHKVAEKDASETNSKER